MRRFFRYTLRTLDVDAARAFYAAVLGPAVDAGRLDIVPLHEQALARGARPHWLGWLEVDEVDPALAAFVERGAMRLSPTWVNPQGIQAATLRDPGGAVLALAKPPKSETQSAPGPSGPTVLWHLLNTNEVERARAHYSELFGWAFEPPQDLGPLGVFHPFAWERSGPPVGSLSDIASRPGVHPHWLFHFQVPALGPAVDAVRARGGTVVTDLTLPGGERLAVCDDSQGAAFALRER